MDIVVEILVVKPESPVAIELKPPLDNFSQFLLSFSLPHGEEGIDKRNELDAQNKPIVLLCIIKGPGSLNLLCDCILLATIRISCFLQVGKPKIPNITVSCEVHSKFIKCMFNGIDNHNKNLNKFLPCLKAES